MKPVQHPNKHQVREWMNQRQLATTPPPTPEIIRQELGWAMLNTKRDCAR